MQAIMTGIYASAVGCLRSHDNGVQIGKRVAQIGTTIHHPGTGYKNMSNFFDPDNFFSLTAMMMSGNSYLANQVRNVLERTGDFVQESGQIPHHFIGTVPTFTAISGEIQTGPNLFWVKSCFMYAKNSGDMTWLRMYLPTIRRASAFLFDLVDSESRLADAPGALMIDVFVRRHYSTDTNAMLVGFFREFADMEQALGNHSGAVALNDLADSVTDAMNSMLWSPQDDHYITDLNPHTGVTRDFVDYDANLIAAAHGIPELPRAVRLFRRIDTGPCAVAPTFVSEKWYGPRDVTSNNVGDSWVGMARIAYFDALARRRYNQLGHFDVRILGPLQQRLLNTTWMFERMSCDGTPQTNRTSHFFEYPSLVAILLRELRFGIRMGFSDVTIDPWGVNEFTYRIGDNRIVYSRRLISVSVVGNGFPRLHRVRGLPPKAAYQVVYCSDKENEMLTTDNGGVLEFTDTSHEGCLTTATAWGPEGAKKHKTF